MLAVKVAGDGQHHNAPEGLFAQHQKRCLDGTNLHVQRIHWRIGQAQQPVGHRSVALHHPAGFMHVNVVALKQFQKLEVTHPVGGNLPVVHQHRAAEVIALKEREAFCPGLLVLLLRFHLFCQHGDRPATQTLEEPEPFLRPGQPEVHFDVVGQLHQRIEFPLPHKIIQRQAVARRLQPPAGGNQIRSRLHGLKDLKNCHVLGQNSYKLLGQRIQSAIHKGRQAASEFLQPKHHSVVEDGHGRLVAISSKGQLRSGPEEQFVPMHPAVQIQNWLARYVSKSFSPLRRDRLKG